ncbi:hypothetical protein C6Q35_11365 [Burkholderia multivorans]|nr:hypothetical protein C6Q35_11365 [Burkholderia multivorans]
MSCVVLSASLREPARGTILYNIHYAIQQDGNTRLAGGGAVQSRSLSARRVAISAPFPHGTA